MFVETSNFRNGSTSSPGRHITSCSNSKHVRYEGNGSLSVDPNLVKRCFNNVKSPQNLGNCFCSLSVFFLDATIELNICFLNFLTFKMDQLQVPAVI